MLGAFLVRCIVALVQSTEVLCGQVRVDHGGESLNREGKIDLNRVEIRKSWVESLVNEVEGLEDLFPFCA
jgi:hypothetical protein